MTGYRRLAVFFAAIALLTVAYPVKSVAYNENYTDDYVKAGDWIQIILPACAFATTLVLKDWQGSKQFLIGGTVTIATVHGVKYLSGIQRPDESTYNSFPSGHTAAAFYGPGFVHRRYGWKYAAPFYLAAVYVGYSRVHANRHWANDVMAGATLSLVANWIFTKPYAKNVEVEPQLGKDYLGLNITFRW